MADVDELTLEQLLEVEVQSVYGASKFLQKITEAPASVTIVTSDEIRRFGYRNLADVLGRVRGFFTTYDRAYAYAGVRGFQRLGDYNTRVLLLIDGVRVNDNVYEQASIGDEFHLDLDLVDRIEIIRGPSSSLYGSNAFFGVVNVVTKRAAQMPGVRVGATIGTHGEQGAQASVGHGFRNGVDLVVSASAADYDGRAAIYFPELDAPETNGGVAERLDWQRRRSVFGKVAFGGLDVQASFVHREKGLPTGAYGIVFNESRASLEDQMALVAVGYDRRLGPVDLRTRGSFGHMRFAGDFPYDAEEDDAPVVLNRDLGVGRWWTAETMLSTTWRKTHRLTSGVEVRHNVRQDQENYDEQPYASYLDDRRRSVNWAWYAQDEWRVGGQHLVSVGVRQDYYDAFTAPVMPRVSWVIMPSATTTVKLLYGGAFRAPNAYETWYAYGPYKANPDLAPERIRTTEAVLERHIGRRYRLSANVFRYWVSDLITLTVDPVDERYAYVNDGDARATGVEFEAEGRWARGVTGRVSYSAQRAVDADSGARLESSPSHLAQMALSFPVFRDAMEAAVDLQVVGARTTKTGATLDAHAVPNLTVTSPALFGHLDVSLSIYNLFDTRYGHPAADDLPQDVITQDGRTVRVRAIWRF
ncbi:MAG: TonB-dependent receptor [Acidobacteria bacterium]|nr:TonB-dependent receptor [Acidobacteriota bacterium]